MLCLPDGYEFEHSEDQIMRIVFLTPDDSLNGGTRVIAIYAKLLQERGHEVLIVSNTKARPSMRDHARALRHGRWLEFCRGARPQAGHLCNSGVPYCRLPDARPIRASDVPDADVIIATWWETAEWMHDMPASKGVKHHLVQGYEAWVDPSKSAQVDAALRLPNVKVAISSGLKREIEQRLGNIGIRVVPNAVDIEQFDARPRARRRVPRVGFVYSQAPSKGPDRYLDIINHARCELPELEVIAFGADPETKATPLPTGTDYHHRPAQDALSGLYASCDAWLFATRVDSFGLPILEAMACRTPVVGLPVGAAMDLLTSNAGVLVKPEQEADIASRMSEALVGLLKAPPATWQTMSENAYERARSYKWSDAADRFEQLLMPA